MDAKTATVAEHANSHPTDHAQGDWLEVPEVTWYKDPGLRKLYAMIPVLFLGATINGYDGSLLNGLQTLETMAGLYVQLSDELSSTSS
jgi:hypothetical protein